MRNGVAFSAKRKNHYQYPLKSRGEKAEEEYVRMGTRRTKKGRGLNKDGLWTRNGGLKVKETEDG